MQSNEVDFLSFRLSRRINAEYGMAYSSRKESFYFDNIIEVCADW